MEPAKNTAEATNEEIYKAFKGVLKGAKDGEVVTRFPPEPSGFLHVGHVKAAMLNFHYAKMYKGKMILRFDDTNPMNEKIEFVQNIQTDLKTLGITPDEITHTSDYFPQIVDYMKQMLKQGDAYADDGTAEEMKDQRDNGIESKHRQRTPEENLKTFQEMIDGKTDGWAKDRNWCIRAKMNMQDKFKCLRDPVFYRMKTDVAHHRHGTKYKAYPTYDFACPIVDSLEGITHAMRSIEYHDRNNGYWWVQKQLGLRKVEIYDFSRLNLVSTILSKRSLKWFVEEGIAEGWDDPRFPTVQGIMRRGMTTFALAKFMLEQGPSKNTNLMEWDKIWAYNKQFIDKESPRYTAIVEETCCTLTLDNWEHGDELTVVTTPLNKNNPDLGTKALQYGKKVFIERGDAEDIKVGDKITLMNWGNAVVTKADWSGGEVGKGDLDMHADLKLDDQNFGGTKKVTWLAADPKTNFKVTLVELDHLITEKKVDENTKVQDIVNKNSYISYTAIADGNMRSLKKGDSIQLERRGFFFVDKIEIGGNQMTLNFIPDGKAKNMSVIKSKLDAKAIASGNTTKEPKADKKKEAAAATEGGEPAKLSKKELNKLKAKEKRANNKAEKKAGGDAPADDAANGKGGAPAAGKGPVAVKDMALNTIPADLSKWLAFTERNLQHSQFLGGSAVPTKLDAEYYNNLKAHAGAISALSHPHTFAWFSLTWKYADALHAGWPEAPAVGGAKKAAKKSDDDLDDLFGDDDADAAPAPKPKIEVKKKKKEVIAMSLVMLEVKPLDSETNLDDLAQRIFNDITNEKGGLFWKTEYKKEPVAFGIYKLIIGFSCEDEKVSVDDIVEKIEALEDVVQSVEITAFNKI